MKFYINLVYMYTKVIDITRMFDCMNLRMYDGCCKLSNLFPNFKPATFRGKFS